MRWHRLRDPGLDDPETQSADIRGRAFAGLFSNAWLWAAVVASVALHAAVIYTPFLQQAFSTTSLGAGDWLRCTAVASSVLWARELAKAIGRIRRARP